ncbi:hypothetical protein ACFQ0K_16465 [Nocardioides caeni]|uniref:WD40 repeat domain-containing protein n=1 Tax=Nocardioides caeni TaxID=574700 RepID=A0A4S8NIC6_9ACTN|nr:hypothetical protein [Nocardioides caeni]THV16085.1 hypothetical protein E9934_07060 [Nocardioides caeni]
MTEKLKDLMDSAADVDFLPVDLGAVVEAGDRAVRRRRLAVVAGAAAAVLLAGTVALAWPGPDRAEDPPVLGSPTLEPAWVVGETLHTPTSAFDLGFDPVSFVRTAVGWGFLDRDGNAFSLVDGQLRQIGRGASGDAALVADETGAWVGWFDSTGARPAMVSVDISTGETVRFDDHVDGPGREEFLFGSPLYFDIDDGIGYWIDDRGVVAADLRDGSDRVVTPNRDARWIVDVTQGLMVRLVEGAEGDEGADVGTEVVDGDLGVVLPVEPGRYVGYLSPDARWVSAGETSPTVVEIATGEERPLGGGARDAVPFEWLDADTVVLFREGQGTDTLDLLTCTVPSGTCDVVVSDLPAQDVNLPGGGYLG